MMTFDPHDETVWGRAERIMQNGKPEAYDAEMIRSCALEPGSQSPSWKPNGGPAKLRKDFKPPRCNEVAKEWCTLRARVPEEKPISICERWKSMRVQKRSEDVGEQKRPAGSVRNEWPPVLRESWIWIAKANRSSRTASGRPEPAALAPTPVPIILKLAACLQDHVTCSPAGSRYVSSNVESRQGTAGCP
jgi:hypothetical protein